MTQIPSITDLLQAGAHFGHPTSKWHPKMKKFIFGSRNGIHILNLEETQHQLEVVVAFVKKTALRGGSILFVGTKRQAAPLVEAAAKSCNMPYVTKRWLGGTITNFASIAQQIRKFKDMNRRQEKGEHVKYTKFEQMKIVEEIEVLEGKFGGMQDMTRVPEAIFLFDSRKDKTALEEASRRGIKVIALCDSNTDPTQIDFPIPANDDATKTIDLIGKVIAQAVNDGRQEWEDARTRLGGTLVKPLDK